MTFFMNVPILKIEFLLEYNWCVMVNSESETVKNEYRERNWFVKWTSMNINETHAKNISKIVRQFFMKKKFFIEFSLENSHFRSIIDNLW